MMVEMIKVMIMMIIMTKMKRKKNNFMDYYMVKKWAYKSSKHLIAK